LKIVSFRTLESSVASASECGALLQKSDEILRFSHPAAHLPAATDTWSAFDLDGGLLPRALELVHAIDEDCARLDALRNVGAVISRESVRLEAPVPLPRKVICIGLNYRDHAREAKLDLPESPLVFSKFSSAVIGPEAPIVVPPGSEKVDFEAELGVVIGRRARSVTVEQAMDCVLGYTNLNDVSARDFQFADGQWQRGKSCDSFCPIGEAIVTREEVRDPHHLSIRLRLNGKTLQDSSTDQLVFGVPELVSYLSQTVTLEPGDLIATGTPPGVGFARTPPVFMQPGDRVEVEIEGLGVLSNPVIAHDPRGTDF
jgi:2-keto-4-pentenoate hydratase/2-oxohepta-3-ene-1,7-dioic acid hydratase in catechol pathway